MRLIDWLRLCLIVSLLSGIHSQATAQPPIVNNRTLNCFLPIRVVAEPVPIDLSYNSYSGERTAFGQKWRSTLFAQIVEHAVGLTVIEPDGFRNTYIPEADRGRPDQEVFVDAIIDGLRAADRSTGGERPAAVYQQERSRLLRDEAARRSAIETVLHGARVPAGRYISVVRGESAIEKRADGSFRRLARDGTDEIFDSLGQLVESSDGNGHTFRLSWHDGLIRRLQSTLKTDAASVQFQYNNQGQMTEIVPGASIPSRFTYHPNGMIATITASDGTLHEFMYDPLGNLTRYTRSAGTARDEWILTYGERYEVEKVSDKNFTTKYVRNLTSGSDETTTTIELLEHGVLKARITKRYDSGRLLSTVAEVKGTTYGNFTLRVSFKQTGNLCDRLGVDGIGELPMAYRQDGELDRVEMLKSPNYMAVSERWALIMGESSPISRAGLSLF